MLFKKRTDYTIVQGTVADAATYRFELTREFPIEALRIRFTVTNAATGPTIRASSNYTHYDNIKRITLTVADGARTRNVVDITGGAAAEYAKSICGMGSDYGLKINNTNSQVNTFYIPIFFAHPQIGDPVSSAMMLPATRFSSNPVLTIQMATLSDLYTANSPAVSNLSVVVDRRDVDDPKWEYWDTELASQTFTLASGLNTLELPIPGAFTGILLESATVATQPLRSNAIFTAGGENRLQYLGNVIRRFRPEDVKNENELSNADGIATASWVGFYHLDFLTDRVGESLYEVGSVLETNFLMATGSRLNLICNTGGTGYLTATMHRIFGDIQKLKAVRR